MTAHADHPVPAVHAFETDEHLVVEIELPPGEPSFTAELTGTTLRLEIARTAAHPEWHVHPDVAAT